MSSASLLSWGRYPNRSQTPHVCSWRKDISPVLKKVSGDYESTLAFGNGRSYGDSCLAISDHVLHLRSLNRLIKADWDSGIIVAEAGVTLDEVLQLSIPKGWFLPVTPGTKFVTLGGAIANDVHGKNHHVKGTFGCHVRQFGLIRSDSEPVSCSVDSNAELFAATIGGLGLTGIIEWIEIQLIPVKSSLVDVIHVRFDSLDEFFALSNELDKLHEYAVAWIDCLATGNSLGRGIYIVGDHAIEGGLECQGRRKLNVPVVPPISFINQVSLRLFNSVYYKAHKAGRHKSRPGYESYFYPLDRINNWNRIYGPRGFQQYQCVLPEQDAEQSTAEILNAIAKERTGSFLAVLKRFGHVKSPGLLSFPVPGITLALDFPQRGKATSELFDKLDTIVRNAGGRLYPAKDAHMSGLDFRNAYPAWQELEKLHDPVLSSQFWDRVTNE